LDGSDSLYVLRELQAIGKSLNSVQLLTPQAAVSVPSTLIDGMQRLARAPWRPVTGQTEDAWVYWDASAAVWKLLNSG